MYSRRNFWYWQTVREWDGLVEVVKRSSWAEAKSSNGRHTLKTNSDANLLGSSRKSKLSCRSNSNGRTFLAKLIRTIFSSLVCKFLKTTRNSECQMRRTLSTRPHFAICSTPCLAPLVKKVFDPCATRCECLSKIEISHEEKLQLKFCCMPG